MPIRVKNAALPHAKTRMEEHAARSDIAPDASEHAQGSDEVVLTQLIELRLPLDVEEPDVVFQRGESPAVRTRRRLGCCAA